MTVAWDRTLLVGDVGGTNARFALAHMVEGRPVLERHQSFPASEHPTFLGGVKAFIDGCDIKPTGGVLAVADAGESGQRVALARLLLSDAPAVRWALAVTDEQDPATLRGDDIFGYGDNEFVPWHLGATL